MGKRKKDTELGGYIRDSLDKVRKGEPYTAQPVTSSITSALDQLEAPGLQEAVDELERVLEPVLTQPAPENEPDAGLPEANCHIAERINNAARIIINNVNRIRSLIRRIDL